MEKKIKLKLNKQIVSKLNNVKGGTDVTRTCPTIGYSQEPEPETDPQRGGTGICKTEACLPSEDTNVSTCQPSIYMCTVYHC